VYETEGLAFEIYLEGWIHTRTRRVLQLLLAGIWTGSTPGSSESTGWEFHCSGLADASPEFVQDGLDAMPCHFAELCICERNL